MAARAQQPMPDDIHAELTARGLWDEYQARPYYQRNDYLAWIARARRPETRRRRLEQMLTELEQGGIYMKINHPPSRKSGLP